MLLNIYNNIISYYCTFLSVTSLQLRRTQKEVHTSKAWFFVIVFSTFSINKDLENPWYKKTPTKVEGFL